MYLFKNLVVVSALFLVSTLAHGQNAVLVELSHDLKPVSIKDNKAVFKLKAESFILADGKSTTECELFSSSPFLKAGTVFAIGDLQLKNNESILADPQQAKARHDFAKSLIKKIESLGGSVDSNPNAPLNVNERNSELKQILANNIKQLGGSVNKNASVFDMLDSIESLGGYVNSQFIGKLVQAVQDLGGMAVVPRSISLEMSTYYMTAINGSTNQADELICKALPGLNTEVILNDLHRQFNFVGANE